MVSYLFCLWLFAGSIGEDSSGIRLVQRAHHGRDVIRITPSHGQYAQAKREEKVMAKSVLVVDDDPIIRSALVLFLRRLKFDSSTARTAEEAIELIQRKSYDVVITDYQMPGMNGVELIKKIRAESPRSITFLMTGCANDEILRSSGADLCLHKPFSIDVLRESLERFSNGPNEGSGESRESAGYNKPS
jgi:CheY-like chemotaxis protein